MAKPSLTKLKLKKKEEFKVIKINDIDIQIKQYLDIKLKSNIIQGAVRGSVVDFIVDELLMDAYLHILMVEYYTDLTFTEKQQLEILDTYDLFQSNGIFEEIISAIPPEEYNYIFDTSLKLVKEVNSFNASSGAAIQDLIKLLNFAGVDKDKFNEALESVGLTGQTQ
jgi:hypothetical protein